MFTRTTCRPNNGTRAGGNMFPTSRASSRPAPRGEEFCDAATKTHINDNPAYYYNYAFATVFKFQLHDYIARKILKQPPQSCNYADNKEVGTLLENILEERQHRRLAQGAERRHRRRHLHPRHGGVFQAAANLARGTKQRPPDRVGLEVTPHSDPARMRYLITSALPYINGVKHLGNLVGSMLPADAYARFQRARGNEVLFICATDEHGTPAELAAHEAGLPIDEYCAKMHSIQKDLGNRFGLSFDHFGRSHSTAKPRGHPALLSPARSERPSRRTNDDARSIRSTINASFPIAMSSAPAAIAATSGPAAISARTALAFSIQPT